MYIAPLIRVNRMNPYIVDMTYSISNNFLSNIRAANKKIFLTHCRGLVVLMSDINCCIVILYRKYVDDKIIV